MISLKTLSLLLFLISISQYTSARPSQVVDKRKNTLSISADTPNTIEGRGIPFDFSQIGSLKSLGDSNNALPAVIPFLGKKDESKSADELPFDASSFMDKSGFGDLPFDLSLLPRNKIFEEANGATPVDSSQLTNDDATEKPESQNPLKTPFIGIKSGGLDGGDFPFGFSRRSEIVPSSTESQGIPFVNSFLGGKNPFSQFQKGFPSGLIPSGTGDITKPFGNLPFNMPLFGNGAGNGVGNFGSGGFPTNIPFFTSERSSSDHE